MTTQTLRNQITVTNWNLTTEMMTISYFRNNNGQSKPMHLILQPTEYLKELNVINAIDGFTCLDHEVALDDKVYIFEDFVAYYKMSQWDALLIAIRHEQEIELNNDLDMLELDSALNALK